MRAWTRRTCANSTRWRGQRGTYRCIFSFLFLLLVCVLLGSTAHLVPSTGRGTGRFGSFCLCLTAALSHLVDGEEARGSQSSPKVIPSRVIPWLDIASVERDMRHCSGRMGISRETYGNRFFSSCACRVRRRGRRAPRALRPEGGDPFQDNLFLDDGGASP